MTETSTTKTTTKYGQELAFDLDPENITCPIHGTLADKMKRNQGLSFCELELEMVKQEAIGLYEFLANRFSEVRAVYSGRGFHLHVLDKKAYSLSTQERLELAQEVKKAGFHIDEWVTSGEMRLIRLPYSLNGLVSRIVLPLTKDELESFDAIHDERCLPKVSKLKSLLFNFFSFFLFFSVVGFLFLFFFCFCWFELVLP